MVQELSQRQLRVGQEVQKVIATAIEQGEVRSEEISKAFITITKVLMSPDLKYATVYLTTLNGKNLGVVLEQLSADEWLFKKLVANKLKLRFTPEINFRADDTFDEVERNSQPHPECVGKYSIKHAKICQAKMPYIN